MNPILFLIGWGVTLLMSVITLIIELPIKLICATISIVFITLVAFIAPIGENWNINVSDKTCDNIEKFCKYSISIKKWIFLKIYNAYKKALI
jgi:hypothetical protein